MRFLIIFICCFLGFGKFENLLPESFTGSAVYDYEHPFAALDNGVVDLDRNIKISNLQLKEIEVNGNRLYGVSKEENNYVYVLDANDGSVISVSPDIVITKKPVVVTFIYYSEYYNTLFAGMDNVLLYYSEEEGVE